MPVCFSIGLEVVLLGFVQIGVLKDELHRLEYEVGCMEQRNLQMIKTVSNHHHKEMENSQRLFALANQRRYTPLLSIDGSASGDQTDSKARMV